jgi:hypothetical protein
MDTNVIILICASIIFIFTTIFFAISLKELEKETGKLKELKKEETILKGVIATAKVQR